jgi:GH24 family phage-related lysozyme (muramidase)
MKFNRLYSLTQESVVEESFMGNVKALLGMALLMGFDVHYGIPKLKEMVKAKLHETSQEEKQELVDELPVFMRSAEFQNKINKIAHIFSPEKKIPSPKPVQPAIEQPEALKNDFLDDAYTYIKKHEGVFNTMYRDIYGNWTIGIGHLIKPGEFKKFQGKTLTNTEIEQLCKSDINNKLASIKRDFGKHFDSYPTKLKIAILDGYFRGDISGSPQTRNLIMQKRFPEAAQEYLNNKEYNKAKKAKSGVASRMEKNASIIANTRI